MRIGQVTIGPRKRRSLVAMLVVLSGLAFVVDVFDLGWEVLVIAAIACVLLLAFGMILAELRRQRWANLEMAESLGSVHQRLEELMETVRHSDRHGRLRWEYLSKGLHEVDDTFVLYRIIGNDLPPRHVEGQSIANLRFILDNEPEFPAVTKRWVLNRIVDPDTERRLMAMLDEHQVGYLRIPFDLTEYREAGWRFHDFEVPGFTYSDAFREYPREVKSLVLDHVYHDKNLYVMNNNGARNTALNEGRDIAKWVLPWDGNCFLPLGAWEAVRAGVTENPHLQYFTVPMVRVLDNSILLDPEFVPIADEEPQLIFRQDAREEFDEDSRYGRRPKVELFYRLGITGIWDQWASHAWEKPRPDLSPDAGLVGTVGWVARLSSGQGELEVDIWTRGKKRMVAIRERIDRIDLGIADQTMRQVETIFLDGSTLRAQVGEIGSGQSRHSAVFEDLLKRAEASLGGRLYSVVDKTTVPPSGDRHDYWPAAPNMRPSPGPGDGFAFVKRVGEMRPGNILWEPGSEPDDRIALQSMIDETFVCTLAGRLAGDARFFGRASDLLEAWFVAPRTRMNPHLEYAQVVTGHDQNQGPNWGIIETKDFYYLLDAIRLLEADGVLGGPISDAVRAWFAEYSHWLRESSLGKAEARATDNRGTWYDVQTGAIQAYLGNTNALLGILRRSHERVSQQFAPDGSQPEELARTLSQHYCHYNLQGWLALAALADGAGQNLFGHVDPRGPSLKGAMQWLLDRACDPWPFEQVETFDEQRTRSLAAEALAWMPELEDHGLARDPIGMKQEFSFHYGIRPFWWIGSRSASTLLTAEAWDGRNHVPL